MGTRISHRVLLLLATSSACGDDDSQPLTDARRADSPIADVGMPDAPVEPAVRGKYLVDHVIGCPDCHTPRLPTGGIDTAMYMSGAVCFIDAVPAMEGVGCLHSRNLTNHPTGLANRSDAEIKTMFQDGMRPNGTFLSQVMPYYVFHNMTADDADAIVAYLRTIPGIDKTIPANEAPFADIPAAVPPLLETDIPMPTTVDAQTTRGRYLATKTGLCLECHTPHSPPGAGTALDTTKLFAGGEGFPIGGPFGVVTSRNLTPHATGLAGMWTATQIVTTLKLGVDNEGVPICPPMPVGPMGPYGGLLDDDAAAIAAYILALPPVENLVPTNCTPPPP